MSGLRMVAQSAAREFGPAAIHVAHVVIDGGVASDQLKAVLPNIVERLSADGLLSVDDIAQNYWMLHTQPRTVWTQNWTGDRSRSRSTGAGGSHPW